MNEWWMSNYSYLSVFPPGKGAERWDLFIQWETLGRWSGAGQMGWVCPGRVHVHWCFIRTLRALASHYVTSSFTRQSLPCTPVSRWGFLPTIKKSGYKMWTALTYSQLTAEIKHPCVSTPNLSWAHWAFKTFYLKNVPLCNEELFAWY